MFESGGGSSELLMVFGLLIYHFWRNDELSWAHLVFFGIPSVIVLLLNLVKLYLWFRIALEASYEALYSHTRRHDGPQI